MKSNLFKLFLLFTISILLANCATQRTSAIVGGKYDQEKNETDYFVLPYGSVTLSGKWDKTRYNTISKQQFFRNQDSVDLAIAFLRFNSYEFNVNGSKKGYEFVKAFYEWDSNYFVDSYGLSRETLVSDSTNNFMIYRIYGNYDEGDFDTYFLIGEKNGNTSNFSISFTDKWTEDERIGFLKDLFLAKKEE